MADARMQPLGGLLGPVLVDEAQPSEASKITRMITASLRSPAKNDAPAVTASRISNGDRSCRPSTGKRPRMVRAHRVRPEHPQAPGRLRRRQARPATVQPASTSGTAIEPAATTSSGAAGTGLAVAIR
jgi:hypothetical protein